LKLFILDFIKLILKFICVYKIEQAQSPQM